MVSETIPTHEYESKVMTKAFEEITGIKVTHDLIQEGDVIEKLQVQMQSGQNVFDGYVKRLRPDRYAFPLRPCDQSDGLDGRGR